MTAAIREKRRQEIRRFPKAGDMRKPSENGGG
jgi:hypothetical protein